MQYINASFRWISWLNHNLIKQSKSSPEIIIFISSEHNYGTLANGQRTTTRPQSYLYKENKQILLV
jgi:hypothetical protein